MPPVTKTNNKRAAASDDAASSGTNKKTNDDASSSKSPWQLHEERLDAIRDSDTSILGPMLIQGIPAEDLGDEEDYDDEDEDEDDDGIDKNALTSDQVGTLRYILITKNREKLLDEMRELVLGDQADSDFLMFNTSFSYHVKDSFYQVLQPRWKKLSQKPHERFDLLMAYTHTLFSYDVWVHDNEGDMEGMVKDLAKMWKTLLKSTDAVLGVDAAFTRPGVLSLLEQFQNLVESAESEPPFKFKYM